MTDSQLIHSRTSYRGYASLGVTTIIVGFGGFLAWSSLARLDAAAIASGTVAVESSRRPVQHLEGGIVSAIEVQENATVRKGQILFRLTSAALNSKLTAVSAKLDQLLTRRARLMQERKGDMFLVLPAGLSQSASGPDMQRLMQSEQALLEMSVRDMRQKLAHLAAKRAEIDRALPGLNARVRALTYEVDSLSSEIERVATVVVKGFYSRNKLAQLKRNLERLKGSRDYLLGEVSRSKAARDVTDADIARAKSEKQHRISEELSKTEIEIISIKAEKNSLSDQKSRVAIRAVSDGVIQAIVPKSVGDVVSAGQTIAEIVPAKEDLRVVAHVQPSDIDGIKTGGTVQIRVSAFSASQTAPLSGKVLHVSADTFQDEATQRPYFKVSVALVKSEIPKSLIKRLTPGMPADVIIAKGERTVLQYIVDPLVNAFAKSMRES